MLFGSNGEIEDERASERRVKNPLCAVFKLSRRRSEEHLPQSVRSRSPGWKVGGNERGSRTEEGERVSSSGVRLQSVSQSSQSGRQARQPGRVY